jgi:hypothetical protein
MNSQEHRGLLGGSHVVRHVGIQDQHVAGHELVIALGFDLELPFEHVNRDQTTRRMLVEMTVRFERKKDLGDRRPLKEGDLAMAGPRRVIFGAELSERIREREQMAAPGETFRRWGPESGIAHVVSSVCSVELI